MVIQSDCQANPLANFHYIPLPSEENLLKHLAFSVWNTAVKVRDLTCQKITSKTNQH